MSTIKYYDENAKKFFDTTFGLSLSDLYEPFLKNIKKGGKILDAGCGSGRDALYFKNNGFEVEAFDLSEELVKMARENTGLDVKKLSFQEMTYENEFDGVWACASLLHVPKSEIEDSLKRISTSLKKDGIFYTSFKYGIGEGERNSRHFNNYTEDTFAPLISKFPEFEVIREWKTADVRPGREEEYWLNLILRKN